MILKSTTSIHLLIYPSSDLHYLLPERKHPPSFHCIYFNPFFIQMPEEVLQETNQIPTLTCLKSSIALKINLKSFDFFREAFINAHSACCWLDSLSQIAPVVFSGLCQNRSFLSSWLLWRQEKKYFPSTSKLKVNCSSQFAVRLIVSDPRKAGT